MERVDQGSVEGKSGKKSKSRMKRQRVSESGGGGQKPEPKTDEFGQLYGDYEPTYGSSGGPQQQQLNRGGRDGESSRGGRVFESSRRGRDGGSSRGGRDGGSSRGGRDGGSSRGDRNGGSSRGGRDGGSSRRDDGNNWGGRGSGWGGRGDGRSVRGREFLKPGMKGFLCTTNARWESDCVQEVYKILNEYYYDDDQARELGIKQAKTEVAEGKQKEQPDEMDCQDAGANNEGVQAEDVREPESDQMMEVKESEVHCVAEEEDVDKALVKELKDKKSEWTEYKMQNVKTGIYQTVFIRATVDKPEPVELAHRVFEEVTSSQRPKAKNIMQFLPIELTCYANQLDEIKSKGKELIDKYLKVGHVSYRIVCNSQFNSSFMRDDFIATFASMVGKANPLSFVDLTNAQFTICVEVLRSIMCIGIVKDFQKFKKYNLSEAGIPTSQEKPESKCKNDSNPKDNKTKKKINAKGEVPNSRDQVETGTDLQKEETATQVARDEIDPPAPAEENQDVLNAAAKSEDGQATKTSVVALGEGGQEAINPVIESDEGGQEALNPAVESDEGGQEALNPAVESDEGEQEALNDDVEPADEGEQEALNDDVEPVDEGGQEALNPVVGSNEGGQEALNPVAEPADEGNGLDHDVPESSVESDNTVQASPNNETEPVSAPENRTEETACEINSAGPSDDAGKSNEVQVGLNEDNKKIENEENLPSENIPQEEEFGYYNNHYWKIEFEAIDL